MEWTSSSNNKKTLGLCQKAPKEPINSNLKKLGKESGKEFEDLTKQVVHRITFSSSIFLASCLSANECCRLIQKEVNGIAL